MKIAIIVLIVLVALYFFLFNKTTNRIREIQTLVNKDRSVCDVINTLEDWQISQFNSNGLELIIRPEYMPMYSLYITYKGERPTNEEIEKLHWELTNENSIVTKAHRQNILVVDYMQVLTVSNEVAENAARALGVLPEELEEVILDEQEGLERAARYNNIGDTDSADAIRAYVAERFAE